MSVSLAHKVTLALKALKERRVIPATLALKALKAKRAMLAILALLVI